MGTPYIIGLPCFVIISAGDGGHAGAQLMPLRNDASLAAAELAIFVEQAALGTGEHMILSVYFDSLLMSGRSSLAVLGGAFLWSKASTG